MAGLAKARPKYAGIDGGTFSKLLTGLIQSRNSRVNYSSLVTINNKENQVEIHTLQIHISYIMCNHYSVMIQCKHTYTLNESG